MKPLLLEIETVKNLESWDAPPEISVAATRVFNGPTTIWRRPEQGYPQPLGQEKTEELLSFLDRKIAEGYKVFSWAGTGFDWRLLGALTGRKKLAAELARLSYDPMFQFLAVTGFPVGLKAVGEAYNLYLPNTDDTPKLWEKGERRKVIAQLHRKVEVLEEVLKKINRNKSFAWYSATSGTYNSILFPRFMTVEAAMELPLPERQLMGREGFVDWIFQEA